MHTIATCVPFSTWGVLVYTNPSLACLFDSLVRVSRRGDAIPFAEYQIIEHYRAVHQATQSVPSSMAPAPIAWSSSHTLCQDPSNREEGVDPDLFLRPALIETKIHPLNLVRFQILISLSSQSPFQSVAHATCSLSVFSSCIQPWQTHTCRLALQSQTVLLAGIQSM